MKILILILLTATLFRFYGLNWDQNQHLHPDERMITLVTLNIHLPANASEWDKLLTPQSPLNPKFFAYGSFPIYLLKTVSGLAGNINPWWATYDGAALLGRILSTLFDLGTIILLFYLGKKVFNQTVGLLSSSFYSIAVLPIQLSHFYAVDTPLTFFITATLYRLLHFYDKPSTKNVVFVGILFGLALATKTSAAVLIIPILVTIILKFFPRQNSFTPHHLLLTIKKTALILSPLALSAVISFSIIEPYALIDFPTFLKQTLEQQAMTRDAFTFPYTLQYVGKIPYLYELKNIFLWGLGPVLSVLAFIGSLFFTFRTRADTFQVNNADTFKKIILITFFWVYFLVVGSFAIGFMRYMLPLYPLLCLFAAFFIYSLKSLKLLKQLKLPFLILNSSLLILILVWPLSFITIYSQPNTRTLASQWIVENIPAGAAIATEHWDDGLPIGYQQQYEMHQLPMYDPDTPLKWDKINLILSQSDYIIIASNRLYTPLMKLTNCSKLPAGRCYSQTAQYYQMLFNNQLGFTQVAEFTIYPALSIFDKRYPINDIDADESFTVYDHPKVMIFKKSV